MNPPQVKGHCAMTSLRFAVVVVALGQACQAAEVCDADGTCASPSKASAMLQVSAKAHSLESPGLHQQEVGLRDASESTFGEGKAYLDEARLCLPDGLRERHLTAIRRLAASLTMKAKATTAASADVDGTSASLDAAGFKALTSLCCPREMEIFFGRLLDNMGLEVCSKPHIQGLMHWFSCVPDMDYGFLVDTINNGNPCKYWTTKGTTCPALTPSCEGKYCR